MAHQHFVLFLFPVKKINLAPEYKMNYEITQAVQSAITPGEHFDNFYSSEECTKKAAYPTLVDNRFTVALNSPRSLTSTPTRA
jgi:hypothetical protein